METYTRLKIRLIGFAIIFLFVVDLFFLPLMGIKTPIEPKFDLGMMIIGLAVLLFGI